MKKTFGEYLRDLRIEVGYSLRAFAKEVGMQPSNLSLIENDKVNPPRDKEILFKLAEALKLEKGSEKWGNFFDLSVKDIDKLPVDISNDEELRDMLPIMLRTIANAKLSKEEILKLINKIKENK
ncbi:MAG: helix-turn-helix transcriptional regulator [Candidatus Firestonebacteria bacterium]|nr:helix-turn-helix transcriptional regulator [Candidatus Firestonebacteria bacterium]